MAAPGNPPGNSIDLRPVWQLAAFGIIAAALISLALLVGRACGFVEFWPEMLPGAFFGSRSAIVDWASYFTLGGLLGLVYHAVFRGFSWTPNWRMGFAIGVVQWLFFGVLIGLREPFLANNPAFLPSTPPLYSITGFLLAALMLALNGFFGGFVGLLAGPTKKKSSPEISGETPGEIEKGIPSSPPRPEAGPKAA